MLKTLFVLALRHYRDASSWAAIIAAFWTTQHWQPNPTVQNAIETILGAAITLCLWLIDGRNNPNTNAAGAIDQRAQIPPGTVPVVTDGVQNPTNHTLVVVDVPVGSAIVQNDPATAPKPVRPGFGPYPGG